MSNKTTFYIVRHGESQANAGKYLGGKKDVKLTEEGEKQASKVAKFFEGKQPDIIFSSPMTRAKQTAKIITSHNKFSEAIVDSRIREKDFGDKLEGMSWSNFKKQYPKLAGSNHTNNFDFTPYGGDSATQMRNRLYEFFLEKYQQYPNKHVIVVTHGGVILMLAGDFQKLVLDFRCVETELMHGNCDVWAWKFDEEEANIIKFYESGDSD